MKPESIMPNIEAAERDVESVTARPESAEVGLPELGIDKGAERYEQRADIGAIRNDIGLASTLPTPVPISDGVDLNTSTSSVSPIVASDDDLIEKEWVDKAKKIIADTQNDPYLREKEVSRLQVDYIKKRFGRELGVVD